MGELLVRQHHAGALGEKNVRKSTKESERVAGANDERAERDVRQCESLYEQTSYGDKRSKKEPEQSFEKGKVRN